MVVDMTYGGKWWYRWIAWDDYPERFTYLVQNAPRSLKSIGAIPVSKGGAVLTKSVLGQETSANIPGWWVI